MLPKLLTTSMQIPQVSTEYCRTLKNLIITIIDNVHNQNRYQNHNRFCFANFLCIKGGVEVFPNSQKVYQSALNQKISVSGTGFKQGMVFTFEPDLKVKIEYSRIT